MHVAHVLHALSLLGAPVSPAIAWCIPSLKAAVEAVRAACCGDAAWRGVRQRTSALQLEWQLKETCQLHRSAAAHLFQARLL